MNIGEAAQATGISAKMIRHYESIGVLPRPCRGTSGYRRYATQDLQRLHFIRNARDAGLSTEQIKRLLSLWLERNRSAREVKGLVADHLGAIEQRIEGLVRIRNSLAHLVAHCAGEARPECPILDHLAQTAGPVIASPKSRSAPDRQR